MAMAMQVNKRRRGHNGSLPEAQVVLDSNGILDGYFIAMGA
jgi:hypothetical protein